MNKSELIDAVADAAGLTKADSSRALDAMISAVSDAMGKGEQVSILGFGTFLVRHRNARVGRNPQTGAEIEIKAANVPAFKPGKALKDAVN